MRSDEVSDAFALLRDEISAVVNWLGVEIADATTQRNFDAAEALLTLAREAEAIAADVNGAAARWEKLARRLGTDGNARPPAVRRRNLGRLRRGEKTPQEAYWRPILASLVRRGGRARTGEVLDDLERELAGTFTAADLEPLPSDPRTLRWRNAAQWARQELVQEGLLTRSPRGVWEISDAGRQWLAEHQEASP
jgi:hypothetical protein